MKGEGRMSSRRTSKCSPADLLEGMERKKKTEREGINAAISNFWVRRNEESCCNTRQLKSSKICFGHPEPLAFLVNHCITERVSEGFKVFQLCLMNNMFDLNQNGPHGNVSAHSCIFKVQAPFGAAILQIIFNISVRAHRRSGEKPKIIYLTYVRNIWDPGLELSQLLLLFHVGTA